MPQDTEHRECPGRVILPPHRSIHTRKYLQLVRTFVFLTLAAMCFSCATISTIAPNSRTDVTSQILSPSDFSAKHLQNGGLLLSIKKKEHVASVMLLASVSETDQKVPRVYALSSDVESSYMSGERRIVNGKITLDIYFLVDSTAQDIDGSGEYFQIEIPKNLHYMKTSTTRVDVPEIEGLNIVIRSFERAMGDYSGKYHDQLVVLSFKT